MEEKNVFISGFFNSFCPTKKGEYIKTVSLLKQILKTDNYNLMLGLYFLYDCGYTQKDIKAIAQILEENYKKNK